MKPLISIVIPTKDRYIYLKELLSWCRSTFLSKDVEIVVQDNTRENQDIIGFLEELNDNRVRYFHTKEWLSIVDNCDLGVCNSRGRFVTMIGDDDGILPWILEACRWMEAENYDAYVAPRPHYIWPDVSGGLWSDKLKGSLRLKDYTGKSQLVHSKDELSKTLRVAASALGDLPRVYHGIVSRKSLDKLKELSGSYFPGESPDMANAIGLACVIERYIKVDYPVVITGNGYRSTGGEGLRRAHHGRIEDISFLPANTSKNWDVRVPFYWSGITIYAQSAMTALKRTSNKRIIDNLNLPYLYAYCLVFELNYFGHTLKIIAAIFGAAPLKYLELISKVLSLLSLRLAILTKNYLRTRVLGDRAIAAVDSIGDAAEKVEINLGDVKRPWQKK